MISDDEIERTRKNAERCKFQRGTQGVWARHWLQLHERYTALRAQATEFVFNETGGEPYPPPPA